MVIRTTRNALLFAAATALASCGGENEADAPAGNGAAAVDAGAEAGNPALVPASADSTIAETLGGSADHSSLLAAVRAAGLEATLAGPGPYTVFAPANGAFQKLPAGTVDTLMKPEEKSRLTTILTYHIVPGVVTVADLAKAAEAAGGTAELATLGGGNLKVSRSGDVLVVTDAAGGQARVTQPDLVQSNGMVHVVDAVLMPS